MIDKDEGELSEPDGAVPAGSGGMAEALESIKAASPSLAGDINAANVTAESLADSHDRATSDQPGKHAAAD
jgi:hypothetical protein